jgi:hypothetical protein
MNLHEEIKQDFSTFGYNLELTENIRGLVAKCTRPAPKSKFGIKYLFNYRFSSEASRIKYLGEYLDTERKRNERKEQEKQEKKAINADFKASDHFKVGEYVVNTWGYEQTNIEFYEVIEVKNKTILVQEVGGMQVVNSLQSHGMANYVVPDGIPLKDSKPFLLKLKMVNWSGKPECKICNPKSYYYFHKWSGKPQYQSWYY